jgi:hypothetical protein
MLIFVQPAGLNTASSNLMRSCELADAKIRLYQIITQSNPMRIST